MQLVEQGAQVLALGGGKRRRTGQAELGKAPLRLDVGGRKRLGQQAGEEGEVGARVVGRRGVRLTWRAVQRRRRGGGSGGFGRLELAQPEDVDGAVVGGDEQPLAVGVCGPRGEVVRWWRGRGEVAVR